MVQGCGFVRQVGMLASRQLEVHIVQVRSSQHVPRLASILIVLACVAAVSTLVLLSSLMRIALVHILYIHVHACVYMFCVVALKTQDPQFHPASQYLFLAVYYEYIRVYYTTHMHRP